MSKEWSRDGSSDPIKAPTREALFDIVRQFRGGAIGKTEAVDLFTSTLKKAYDEQLEEEKQRAVEVAKQGGFETMTTDTSSRRSAKWFRENKKPFATGVATNCFAFAICHEKVGMGAAHLNTITLHRSARFVEKALDNPFLGADFALLERKQAYRELVSLKDLENTIESGVNLAFKEFGQLLRPGQGIPLKGTYMMGGGIDYLSPAEAKLMTEYTLEVIKVHPRMNDGRARSQGRRVFFNVEIGKKGGVIYTGQGAPELYKLRFV